MRGLLLCTLLATILSACKSNETSSPAKEQTVKESVLGDTAKVKQAKPVGLSLTPQGQHFDPAIQAESLPSGSYYCDMGTVHYARSEKGDHTCPICKMKLTLKE